MSLPYGFVKSKVKAVVGLKSSGHRSEIQYHVHLTLVVGGQDWGRHIERAQRCAKADLDPEGRADPPKSGRLE